MRNDRAPLRIGILGAARIAPAAIIRPARTISDARVAAIAARNPERARAFAARHGIPRVLRSYEALIVDPEIDAIYNPLPNSLHSEWSIRALEAGKHVLCEKPMAANAYEAEWMAQIAFRTGRVLAEAFHYRYHPLADRLKSIVISGELGGVKHIQAHFCIPMPLLTDIRYNFGLAGGATMDLGCYAVNLIRFLAGAEPEVIRAEARIARPEVDRWMAADLLFADGRTARITCALFSAALIRMSATVHCDRGQVSALNPYLPHLFNRLKVRDERGTRVHRVHGEATYTYQLRAFVAAIREGVPMPTDAVDAVANMRVIDAIYRKAGLRVRGTDLNIDQSR